MLRALCAILAFFDRCASLTSLYPPPAALGDAALKEGGMHP